MAVAGERVPNEIKYRIAFLGDGTAILCDDFGRFSNAYQSVPWINKLLEEMCHKEWKHTALKILAHDMCSLRLIRYFRKTCVISNEWETWLADCRWDGAVVVTQGTQLSTLWRLILWWVEHSDYFGKPIFWVKEPNEVEVLDKNHKMVVRMRVLFERLDRDMDEPLLFELPGDRHLSTHIATEAKEMMEKQQRRRHTLFIDRDLGSHIMAFSGRHKMTCKRILHGDRVWKPKAAGKKKSVSKTSLWNQILSGKTKRFKISGSGPRIYF